MYRRDEAMLRLQEGGLDDGRTQANEQRPQQRYGGPVAAQVPGLEEQLEDATRAHSALQKQYGELSLDYRHCLDRLWKQNAGLSTRRDR